LKNLTIPRPINKPEQTKVIIAGDPKQISPIDIHNICVF
jgi:hypothetical protein